MSIELVAARMFSVVALALMLGACGGGGSDGTTSAAAAPAPTPTAPAPPSTKAGDPVVLGVFGGTLSDEQEYDLLYVVMHDGTKVGFFGTDWSGSFRLVGSWASYRSTWSWISLDGKQSGMFNGDYRGEPAYVAVSFDMAVPRLSGQVKAGQLTPRTVSFVGGVIPGSGYRFDAPSSLGQAAGPWQLADVAGNPMVLEIAADGGLKGSYRGCSLSGIVKPSEGGENALAIAFDFDQPVATCQPDLENSADYGGFAIALPMDSGGTRLLLHVGSSAGWNWMSVAAVGQR